jgi:hypothetical protein
MDASPYTQLYPAEPCTYEDVVNYRDHRFEYPGRTKSHLQHCRRLA